MSTLTREPPSLDKRDANICFALFVLSALAGLLQCASPIPFGAGFEMVAIATNLAQHGAFANPFQVANTGPTAANPPLYPFFLAILMKTLRLPALVLAIASVGNVAMNAITASLLPRISRLFYGNIVPGVIASVFWLTSVRLMPAWDVSYTVAGLLLFCLCFASSKLGAGKSASMSLLAGTIAGLLFLFNPSTSLIVLPWLAFLLLRKKIVLREAGIVLAIMFLFGFGWAFRNHRELRAFVVRTNLGSTLYASNNDCAAASLIEDELRNCHQTHHPNNSLSEARLLETLGEVKYDQKRTADTKEWIKTHPAHFRALTLQRFRNFWFPPRQRTPFRSYIIWVATALSIPGLTLMIRERAPVSIFVLTVLLIYPVMYYIVISDVRYRYPVLWLSLLPAGYWLARLLPGRLRASDLGHLHGHQRGVAQMIRATENSLWKRCN